MIKLSWNNGPSQPGIAQGDDWLCYVRGVPDEMAVSVDANLSTISCAASASEFIKAAAAFGFTESKWGEFPAIEFVGEPVAGAATTPRKKKEAKGG